MRLGKLVGPESWIGNRRGWNRFPVQREVFESLVAIPLTVDIVSLSILLHFSTMFPFFPRMYFSVQFSPSVAESCPTLCDPMNRSTAALSITNSWSSLRLTSIESLMPSSHLILCHPLLLLPPIPPSIRVFSNESTLRIRWPKYWSFSFSMLFKATGFDAYIFWTFWHKLWCGFCLCLYSHVCLYFISFLFLKKIYLTAWGWVLVEALRTFIMSCSIFHCGLLT